MKHGISNPWEKGMWKYSRRHFVIAKSPDSIIKTMKEKFVRMHSFKIQHELAKQVCD